MTGDATLDAVTAGMLGFLGLFLIFEIAVRWAVSALVGNRTGGGWDGPE